MIAIFQLAAYGYLWQSSDQFEHKQVHLKVDEAKKQYLRNLFESEARGREIIG